MVTGLSVDIIYLFQNDNAIYNNIHHVIAYTLGNGGVYVATTPGGDPSHVTLHNGTDYLFIGNTTITGGKAKTTYTRYSFPNLGTGTY